MKPALLLTARPFESYFREQFPKLVAELDYVLGDEQLAFDVAQEAFIKQYVRWARLAHYDKPGAWVRKVAFRAAFRKRKSEHPTLSIDAAANASVDSPDVARIADVRAAICQLPEQQRVAVVLHYYRDLALVDVAKIMGCRENTVKVHLHRARAKLAEILVDYRPAENNSQAL